MAGVLRRFAEISAAARHLLQPSHPLPLDKPAEATAAKPGAVTVSTGVSAGSDVAIKSVDGFVPDQQEIERRRNMVRTLFNDFWNGAYERPAAFAERLDQAQDYVNERLTACSESSQLDNKTRIMARANTDAAFDFAREVAEAQVPLDLVQAWTTHATKQFDVLTKQVSEMTTLGRQ
jgi:hypothetical protein